MNTVPTRKRMTIWLAATGIVAVVALILAAGYYYEFSQESTAAKEIVIEDQDLSSIHDGVYYGAYEHGRVTYGVEVTVKNYTITDIKVVSNRNNKYARSAEGVIERVLARGNVEVDAIAGATTSSKALLKAIEQALACNL